MYEALPAPGRKLQVLFVDDEPSILRGLRSIFHRERNWDMAFAASAAEALRLMSSGPFDVLITDMRMPEMDGAQLLEVVQQQWPQTARIVLSGQSDPDALMRVFPTMHGFLAKPCSSAVLRSTIKRCTSVAAVTDNPTLRTIINRVEKLPSPSVQYLQLTRLASDPRSRLGDITAVVESEPALALKVMQIASSSAFGGETSFTSIARAVQYLGLELIQAIALSTSLCSPFEGTQLPISIASLQKHAVRTATLSRAFIQDTAGADLAFASGLLHDVGRIVLQLGLPAEYGRMCDEIRVTGESLVAAERRYFGADHALVGGCLMRLWGLPAQLIEAVEVHHTPSTASPAVADIVAVVHVAETLSDNSDSTEIDVEFLRSRSLGSELPRWRDIAARSITA
jgi:HD-like signal output (HDOD) protein